MADWVDRGLVSRETTMSVNISAARFTRPELLYEVGGVLARSGLEPRRLVLEITESIAMADARRAIDIIRRLRELGVGIALDDFGTGHSSLAYLQRIPVTSMKIDRSFVSGMAVTEHYAAIVRTIITLAKNFGLKVVAEGVETDDQLRQLMALNCDQAQGYRFAKPVGALELEAMMLDETFRRVGWSNQLAALFDRARRTASSLG